jgi:AhpC/TSA family protein/cytochrome c biogenesis DsbD-like protein
LEQSREGLKKRGLGLAAISYDSVPTLKFFSDRKHITFPLLSDESSSIIRAFGILNEQVPKTSEVFGIPNPVTYIVNESGIIESRDSDEDYRRRYTVGNLLKLRTGVEDVEAKRLKITQSVSDSVVHGGQRFKVRLDIELPPRNHVYAPGVEGYIPIEWRVADSPSFAVEPVAYPQSRTLHLKAIDEAVPVYEGKFTLEREIIPAQRILAPEIKIEGSLRYQVCDDVKCYTPETVPIVWIVRYEPHDTTRAPAELRRKKH